MDGIRDAVASVDESLALSDAEPLGEAIARESARTRTLSQLLVGFSVFGLLLVGVGLASSLAYAVSQRRSELSMRLALGASPARIVLLVARGAAAIVMLGLAGGATLAMVVIHLLRSEIHGVSASDPVTYVLAFSVVVCVALAAIVLPAQRAASLDPAATLRAS